MIKTNTNIKPVIVVIAYNRPDSLARILFSLQRARYNSVSGIKLIISIDGGGNKNKEVYNIAHNFNWAQGEKDIIQHPVNLGLRNHVIFCGNLTQTYGAAIILEEDCFVSHNFYNFSLSAINYYYEEHKVAGISLYGYDYYESTHAVFQPLKDGYDVYFLQVPSSLGQIWTKENWRLFKDYYDSDPVVDTEDKIPEKVKTWPETSWKKYFYKYMVEKDLYFLYPHTSFATNFGDVGSHFSQPTHLYQVPLENRQNKYQYQFVPFEYSNNKYDAFFELLPECYINQRVNIKEDTCIDLFGSKILDLIHNEYLLSSKACTLPLKNYDASLLPMHLNIIYGLKGNYFSYGKRETFQNFCSHKEFLISVSQPIGFVTGVNLIQSGIYYKLGYYLSNPSAIVGMLMRKFKKLQQKINS